MSASDINLTHSDLFSMQKSLIAYLDSQQGNDAALQFAKYFLVAQWIKELFNMSNATSTGTTRPAGDTQSDLETHSSVYNHRKRVYALIEKSMSQLSSCAQQQHQQQQQQQSSGGVMLDFGESLTLTKYLCSLKKTLDKNFDVYLVTILNLSGAGLDTNTPTQVK